MLHKICIALFCFQLTVADVQHLRRLAVLSTRDATVYLCFGSMTNRSILVRQGRLEEITPMRLKGQGAVSSLSHDLSKVAFVSPIAGEDSRIVVVHTASRNTTEVLRWSGDVWSVAWSPNGNELAFIADDPEQRFRQMLYVVGVNRQEVTKLARADDRSAPSWSSDGKRIVFQGSVLDEGSDTRRNVIAIVDRETGQTQDLGEGYDPSWSPDGRLIAYLDHQHAIDGKREHICTVWPDGTNKTVHGSSEGFLLARQELTGPLVWSPDMRYLAYHARAGMKGGRRSLYILDLRTKKAERVFSSLDFALANWKSEPR